MDMTELITVRKATGAYEWLWPADPQTWTVEMHALYELGARVKKEFNFPYVGKIASTCLDYYFVLHSATDISEREFPPEWSAHLGNHGSCMRRCISQDSTLEIHLRMESCRRCKHVVHVYVANITLRQVRRGACRSACMALSCVLRRAHMPRRVLDGCMKALWRTGWDEAWDLVRDK